MRLTRIDGSDLNVFEFDYDITFMVFFMNADGHIYGRYGGRDTDDAEGRMSLPGLKYAMQAALDTHRLVSKSQQPAPKIQPPKYIRKFAKIFRSGCIHCHQVKEIVYGKLKKEGKWSNDYVWRYPLPDNLGMVLEVDRGDVVEKIEPGSAADQAGLKKGDVLEELNGVSIHSFGDAQYALDKAPQTGKVEVSWKRGGELQQAKLELKEGWRKTNIGWRPSVKHLGASLYVDGLDLMAKEKKYYGLEPDHIAFRQSERVHPIAKKAGIKAGDIIVGVDNQTTGMNAAKLHYFVRGNYLGGDRLTVKLIRDGKRIDLPVTLPD